MRRAELLQRAELTAAAYNSLAARGVLPFDLPRRTSRSAEWGEFAAEHALALSLQKSLTREGVAQELSACELREKFYSLLDFAEDNADDFPTGVFFFGVASFEVKKGVESTGVYGLFADITDGVSRAAENLGYEARGCRSLTIVNATELARKVWKRGGVSGRDQGPRLLARHLGVRA